MQIIFMLTFYVSSFQVGFYILDSKNSRRLELDLTAKKNTDRHTDRQIDGYNTTRS